jgi:hypothetical protein
MTIFRSRRSAYRLGETAEWRKRGPHILTADSDAFGVIFQPRAA